MTTDEALREAQKWLDYLEAQKARATKMQELAHLAKTDQKEAQRQMRQMDQQPTVYDGARLADGVRVMVAEIERVMVAEIERLRDALSTIAARDWVENALDPQWAASVARTAGRDDKNDIRATTGDLTVKIPLEPIPQKPGTLGQYLRTVRRADGISLPSMARRMGVSKSQISMIERGLSQPSIRMAARIAQHYDVSIEYMAQIVLSNPQHNS
jgi:DNA-binding XRE family transcriptional regulator